MWSMIVKYFKTQDEFRTWLAKNHDKKTEIWIGFYKKASGKKGVTGEEALDVALCYGWIDGIRKSVDELSYCNRYTPRTARSKWSKINTEKVKRLTLEGLMEAPGLKAVEEARADGRWDRAYDSPKNSQVPEEFLKELKKNKKALAFYKTLKKQSLYSIAYRLQNSKKQETKDKWIKKIIQKLSLGEDIIL